MTLTDLLGSKFEEDRMFGLVPVLRPGLEYQIRVAENTVATDPWGREEGGLITMS